MTLDAIKSSFDHKREMVLRAMAGSCEADAECGEFHPIGERCGFCVHSIKGGCRLRLIASQEAE